MERLEAQAKLVWDRQIIGGGVGLLTFSRLYCETIHFILRMCYIPCCMLWLMSDNKFKGLCAPFFGFYLGQRFTILAQLFADTDTFLENLGLHNYHPLPKLIHARQYILLMQPRNIIFTENILFLSRCDT